MIKIQLWRKLASGAVETGPVMQGVIKNIMWSLFTCYFVPDSLWPHGLQHIYSTTSWSLIKYMSIESVMVSNYLILCWPHLLLIPVLPMAFQIRWPKYWSITISLSNEYSGLLFFRFEWLDLLAIQGILKSLLQHHSTKASVLWHSAFFTLQFSHPYMTTGKP